MFSGFGFGVHGPSLIRLHGVSPISTRKNLRSRQAHTASTVAAAYK